LTRDLLNILHALAADRCDPWCDTSTPQGELLVTILAWLRHVRAPPDQSAFKARFGVV
jgi:hypothetical protein